MLELQIYEPKTLVHMKFWYLRGQFQISSQGQTLSCPLGPQPLCHFKDSGVWNKRFLMLWYAWTGTPSSVLAITFPWVTLWGGISIKLHPFISSGSMLSSQNRDTQITPAVHDPSKLFPTLAESNFSLELFPRTWIPFYLPLLLPGWAVGYLRSARSEGWPFPVFPLQMGFSDLWLFLSSICGLQISASWLSTELSLVLPETHFSDTNYLVETVCFWDGVNRNHLLPHSN